ncbi:toxin-antitoxin system [Flaviflexus ciconiae]|uniref:Toxin-antitoxin system n=1 Tax=Flaviflexus ciconiae TaxID=2496867 RepID=A0A3Q9G7K9_9ACTO|nr:toxin-antitoxin system [Flaviflexus ciconiae]AZQ76968.1 toxin-antitoxin system [Flaviflexus ciconiae]
MEAVIVRGLGGCVLRQLEVQARKHGYSVEAEVRDILTTAVHRNFGMALLLATAGAGGIDGLPIPVRDSLACCAHFDQPAPAQPTS